MQFQQNVFVSVVCSNDMKWSYSAVASFVSVIVVVVVAVIVASLKFTQSQLSASRVFSLYVPCRLVALRTIFIHVVFFATQCERRLYRRNTHTHNITFLVFSYIYYYYFFSSRSSLREVSTETYWNDGEREEKREKKEKSTFFHTNVCMLQIKIQFIYGYRWTWCRSLYLLSTAIHTMEHNTLNLNYSIFLLFFCFCPAHRREREVNEELVKIKTQNKKTKNKKPNKTCMKR